jgi:hypothetical protein
MPIALVVLSASPEAAQMAGTTHELKELASLLREGLITRAQFEQERDALFARGSAPPISSTLTQSSPNLGESVGAYSITGNLGRGGMGIVYRGKHRTSAIAKRQGGEVAVKLLHAQYAQDTSFRDRFEREAAMGLKLDHPNIVKVHDLVIDGGSLALVMELAQGRPLSEIIGKETGPIPWERAWPMFKQLLDAVKYAHAHKVVHRDLKPENVILSPEGQLKVLDFGIAKDLESGKTKTGTGMGTVDYMAPEQYTDAKSVDQRADIYALGMTLYEMLAGRLPWNPSDTEFTVMSLKAKGELPPPTDFYPEIPAGVVKVIRAATTVKPSERIQSIDGFIAALNGEDAALERNGEWAAETPTDAGSADIAGDPREQVEQAFEDIMSEAKGKIIQKAKSRETELLPTAWWEAPAFFLCWFAALSFVWVYSIDKVLDFGIAAEAPMLWLAVVLFVLHKTTKRTDRPAKESDTQAAGRILIVLGIGLGLTWLLHEIIEDIDALQYAYEFSDWALAEQIRFAQYAIGIVGVLSTCFWITKVRAWPPKPSWKWAPAPFVLLMAGLAYLATMSREINQNTSLSNGTISIGVMCVLVYGLNRQKKRLGSTWRIPRETKVGQRVKAAFSIAVVALLTLNFVGCFVFRTLEIKRFYTEYLIEIFGHGPGLVIFASGTCYTLYSYNYA